MNLGNNVVTTAQVNRITSNSSKPIREAIGAVAQTITGLAVVTKQITDYANIAIAMEIDSQLDEVRVTEATPAQQS